MYLANGTKSFDIAGNGIVNTFEYDRGEPLTDICVYSVMPNHFHVDLKEIREHGIRRFLSKISLAYAMYFNAKYKRSGSLLQGRYRSKHINNDTYSRHIQTYIHLNSLDLIEPKWKERGGIKNLKQAEKFLKSYPYSSLFDYLGNKRPEGKILNSTSMPLYFETTKEIMQGLEDWIEIAQDINDTTK